LLAVDFDDIARRELTPPTFLDVTVDLHEPIADQVGRLDAVLHE
jgi:hypothetical protein